MLLFLCIFSKCIQTQLQHPFDEKTTRLLGTLALYLISPILHSVHKSAILSIMESSNEPSEPLTDIGFTNISQGISHYKTNHRQLEGQNTLDNTPVGPNLIIICAWVRFIRNLSITVLIVRRHLHSLVILSSISNHINKSIQTLTYYSYKMSLRIQSGSQMHGR